MATEIVKYERRGEVALLQLDDGKANALSHELITQLCAAIDRAEREARAVLLSGRPGRFCAGFDLKVMLSGVEPAMKLVRRGAELYLRLFELPLPVVMACSGHAVAGGAVLLLTADSRIGVAGDFKIGLNEIAIGMPLPLFVQELGRYRLDPRRRVAATVQARLYDPAAAVEVGFLDEVVSAEELPDEALRQAEQLAKLPGAAYGLTKQRQREAAARFIRDTLDADLARLTPPTEKGRS